MKISCHIFVFRPPNTSITDGGPTLNQHWNNAPCLLVMGTSACHTTAGYLIIPATSACHTPAGRNIMPATSACHTPAGHHLMPDMFFRIPNPESGIPADVIRDAVWSRSSPEVKLTNRAALKSAHKNNVTSSSYQIVLTTRAAFPTLYVLLSNIHRQSDSRFFLCVMNEEPLPEGFNCGTKQTPEHSKIRFQRKMYYHDYSFLCYFC